MKYSYESMLNSKYGSLGEEEEIEVRSGDDESKHIVAKDFNCPHHFFSSIII